MPSTFVCGALLPAFFVEADFDKQQYADVAAGLGLVTVHPAFGQVPAV